MSSFSSQKPYKVSLPISSRQSVSEQLEPPIVEISVNISLSENQIPRGVYRNSSQSIRREIENRQLLVK